MVDLIVDHLTQSYLISLRSPDANVNSVRYDRYLKIIKCASNLWKLLIAVIRIKTCICSEIIIML